jgi:hypothetical protein
MFSTTTKKKKPRIFEEMSSVPILLFIIFSLIEIILPDYVIRGEKTRYSLFCPIPNALWFGPNNQTIRVNSDKYQMKYSVDNVQLTINHLTSFDEGEYLCFNNETNDIIQRYELKIGTIKNVLPVFVLLITSIILLIPIFWYLGRKYSGINQ